MKGQFYVVKKGGIKKGDFVKGTGEDEELLMLQGTKEKGPWYDSSKCPNPEKLQKCIDNGWIKFMDEAVE